MIDRGAMDPGLDRAAAIVGDDAFVAAALRVEASWLRALAGAGLLESAAADAAATVIVGHTPDVDALVAAAEDTGTIVVPLVDELRGVVGDPTVAALVHRGLTSQDVIDSALMQVSKQAIAVVLAELLRVGQRLATLAVEHRDDVMPGRTLTRHAVPITFGLKAARWLWAVIDVAEDLRRVFAELPAQCGGAAGTNALLVELTPQAGPIRQAFADDLGLTMPAVPWHTIRTPVTRLAGTLTSVTDACGVVGAEIAFLSRPEVNELALEQRGHHGRSSTMPQKQNPIGSVLVGSAALQAPFLLAQLHQCAALMADERAAGAWHAEWPALRRLLGLSIAASAQTGDLLDALSVNTDVMRDRALGAKDSLLAERFGSAEAVPDDATPDDYLGLSQEFIDSALVRWESYRDA